MNISYAWLTALVPVSLSPEAVRDLITARCCPVDEMVPLREDLRDVVVGLVVEAARHPNADHLWVTKVDAGRGELLDVVCGAPNVRAGRKYPFAPAGATLPGGVRLEKRKIRGAISNGMLCSARELALGTDHEGILELETNAPPGTPLLKAIPVGDMRIVVDVTPNRPDLLSHLGVAREIAAATGVPVQLPAIPTERGAGLRVPAPVAAGERGRVEGVEVVLEDPGASPRYLGAVVRGVRVGPSPAWLAERLVAVGARPINNIVDITNYLLYELGQPMHAFDLAKLDGPAVVIRPARSGETITTLDGVKRPLDPSMLVIADRARPVAVAGVMGGAESEVSESTTDIFLEVANFDPRWVRRARRALALSTDASYRFERGVDIELGPTALRRALEMIVGIAGGGVVAPPVDLYPTPRPRRRVALRLERVARLLGVAMHAEEVTSSLRSVGFEVEAGAHALDVIVPSWRPDVTREVDLVEEVARLRGYDSFPSELQPIRPSTVPDSPVEVISRRVREHLVALGLLEARPVPFVRGAPEGFVRVVNPIAESEAYLRRDLLDTLARRAEHNLAHRQRDVRLFEVGSAFVPRRAPGGAHEGALPMEELRVAALVMGRRRPPHWTEGAPPDYDEWDAKGLAEEVARVGYPGSAVELRGAGSASARPGALWEVVVDGRVVGGVHRLSLDAPVWAAPAFGVELTLLTIESGFVAPPGEARHTPLAGGTTTPRVRYRPLPVTPAAEFDLALLVPNDMPAAAVERVMREAGGELLERLELFDEYRGEKVPEGYRSLAWRLTFRHPERTLRDKEIAGRRERLLRTLEGELGVRQRTT